MTIIPISDLSGAYFVGEGSLDEDTLEVPVLRDEAIKDFDDPDSTDVLQRR